MTSLSAGARKACSAATTCAPSPTAAATRLIEPAAHVADREHAAAAGLQRSPVAAGVCPVSTKPLASSATPDPASQSVFGSAPMNRNRWRIGARVSSPCRAAPADRLQHAVAAFEPGDLAPASPPRRSAGRRCGRRDSATCSPRGRARARAARPWRPGSRDRPTAWPAELPAPTSATSWPAHSFALERRGPVVHARALELVEVRDVEPPVAGAAGDHDRRAR